MIIKLKSLLLENLNVLDLSKILESAYKVIFDIDDVRVVEKQDLHPPAFCHQYFTMRLFFDYKLKKFVIYHFFYYDKFPKGERKGLSYDEWINMLKVGEEFPRQIANKDLIKGRNPLIRFEILVYETPEKYEKPLDWVNFSKLIPVDEANDLRNVGEVVKTAKKIIDKYIGGDNDNREPENEPVNVPSQGKILQPA